MEYKISYDKVADAAYIKIRDESVQESIEESIEIKEGIIVDLAKNGDIIGVEILNFSKKKIDINNILTKGIESVVSA